MEKMMMTIMMVLVMMTVLSQMTLGTTPTPPPPPPPPEEFICPIDGLVFFTYDELYAHFTTAHPTTPIDITWE